MSCDLTSSAHSRDLKRTWLDCKISPPLIGYVNIEFIFCKLGMRSQMCDGPEVAALCEALDTELHNKNKGHDINSCIQHSIKCVKL